ncbi:MAG: hypothetical protein JWO19_918 [Bryobacterales bacterium]|nr:hypothetical protein [Bryobacterales bacterium]
MSDRSKQRRCAELYPLRTEILQTGTNARYWLAGFPAVCILIGARLAIFVAQATMVEGPKIDGQLPGRLVDMAVSPLQPSRGV